MGVMMKIGAWSRLSEMIRSGQRPVGTFITSLDPATTTIMGSVGFDFLILDAEHGPIDLGAALGHIRAAQAVDTPALVRVIENSPKLIQSFMDAGAAGVVVPHVNTAEAAQRALAATRYGPGGRGMCPVCHAAHYSTDNWREFVENSNRETIMVPMIETLEGVRNAAAIAAVPGIEIILFGPGDLAQDMGLDLFSAKEALQEAWLRVRDEIHAAGKLVMVPDGFGLDGADILFRDMDLLILRQAAKQILADCRAAHRGFS